MVVLLASRLVLMVFYVGRRELSYGPTLERFVFQGWLTIRFYRMGPPGTDGANSVCGTQGVSRTGTGFGIRSGHTTLNGAGMLSGKYCLNRASGSEILLAALSTWAPNNCTYSPAERVRTSTGASVPGKIGEVIELVPGLPPSSPPGTQVAEDLPRRT